MDTNGILIINILTAAICAWGAARKNRNALLWGGLGFIFPLTVLIVAFLPFTCLVCRKNLTNRQWRDRICPDCGDIRSPGDAIAKREGEAVAGESWPPDVEARRIAIVEALESSDPAKTQWATDELQYLPEALAATLAAEYNLGETVLEDDIIEAGEINTSHATQAAVPHSDNGPTPEHAEAMLAQARKKLLGLVFGNEQTARRLVQLEKSANPDASEATLCRLAAERLINERNR